MNVKSQFIKSKPKSMFHINKYLTQKNENIPADNYDKMSKTIKSNLVMKQTPFHHKPGAKQNINLIVTQHF